MESARMESWQTAPADSRRLNDRFAVPGATLRYERRAFPGIWRRVALPCPVVDLCLSGLCFVNPGPCLPLGARIRVTLMLTRLVSVRVEGEVVWERADGHAAGQKCGLSFTDFDSRAWSMLCDAQARFGSEPARRNANVLTFDMRDVGVSAERARVAS